MPNPEYDRASDRSPTPFDAGDANGSGGSGGSGGNHVKDAAPDDSVADTGSMSSDVRDVGTGEPAPPSPDAVAPGPNLVGAWHFEDGARSPVAADSSGSGAVGTLTNMDPATAWVPGHGGGNALAFNPTTAVPEPSVRVALVPRLKDLRRFTVAAWIYRTATSKSPMQQSIVSQQRASGGDEIFNLCLVTDDPVIYVANQGAGSTHDARVSGNAAAFGVWIHLAASFDGATLRLYRNGVLVASTPYAYPLPTSTNPIVIGSNVNTGSEQPFVGYIDDVMIYDGALSDAAVAALAAP
jgi:hypothetical protein